MVNPLPRRADIRDHVRALTSRWHVDDVLRGRPDIVGHATALIEALRIADGAKRREAATAELARLGLMPLTAEDLAETLTKFTEFDPADRADGLPIPAGVRHPLYCFSPLLLLQAELTADRRIGGIPIGKLPLTVPDLREHLYRSINLPLPFVELDEWGPATQDPDPGDASVDLDLAVEKKLGFSLEEVARRLLEIMQIEPDLYLLLLSREIEIAEACLPSFEQQFGQGVWSNRVPLLLTMKAIYELQRAAVMAWTLRQWAGVTVVDMRHLLSDDKSLPQIQSAMTGALRTSGGPGNVLDVSLVHARALRRYLLSSKDWVAIKDLNGILGSLKNGRVGWNHLLYPNTAEGGVVLPRSVQDNITSFQRKQGNGVGVHKSRLDLYCGLDAELVYPMALLEIGRRLVGQPFQLAFDQLIAAHAQNGGLAVSAEDSKAEHLRKKAARYEPNYLPVQRGWGSAGRFDLDQWGSRYSDLSLWTSFANSIQRVLAGRKATRGRLRLFDLALMLITRRFKVLFAQMNAVPVALRLVCDLATSVCQLTTDPILAKILVREECRRNRERHARRKGKRSGQVVAPKSS